MQQITCDGSAELRFAALVDGQVDRRPNYSAVLYELGQPYLYVDGTCRYWLGSWDSEDALQEWQPVRSGMLSAEEMASLEELIDIDRLSPRSECNERSLSDQPPAIMVNGSFSVRCLNNGGLVGETWTAINKFATNLYSRASPLSDAMRIQVNPEPTEPVTNAPPYAWPLDKSVVEFATPSTSRDGYGQTRQFGARFRSSIRSSAARAKNKVS